MPLFGPENAPKLIVSVSLGNSVEFEVRRRASFEVPSSITLDHGDLLVMDGLTQSEYAHRTVPGLQGPRVNLAFRWVTQHIASCPLAGVVGCVLPSCVPGLAQPVPRGGVTGENKVVLLLLILVFSFLGRTWIHISERGVVTVVGVHPHRRCTSFRGIEPFGSGDGVCDCHDAAISRKGSLFVFMEISRKSKLCFFFQGYGFSYLCTPGYASYQVGAQPWFL